MSQRLTFTTASMQNLVISNPTDALYYEVLTPDWESHLTTVRRLDTRAERYDTIGSIRNQSRKPVAVSMYSGEFMNEELWLRKIEGDDRQSRWEFDDGEGNYFSWAVAGPNFELRSIDEGGAPSRKPIATYYPHKRYVMVGMISQRAFLEIEPSVVDSLDTILVSLLVLAKKRRKHSL
ncbi:uncharacterized protein EDB91DRAFT_497621 [Suillus paluster]|uniref:uncharacterized protein n=1 Tax=Suillus paluster TaxID=48578 RepID=UPI001B85DB37|nr:uncharacterized protein EDB91DRAFT_497621 [Suillus paluster]KAG1736934.1 hypothetical protein EDB91DRAFT_497621 [Suillus paluster]